MFNFVKVHNETTFWSKKFLEDFSYYGFYKSEIWRVILVVE